MFRSPPGILVPALVALLAAAGGAEAQDKLRITPAIEVSQGFDSNIGNVDDNDPVRDQDSDFVTTVAPSVEVSHEEGVGHTRLLLGLRSRSHWDHSELNAVDRYARGEVERLLTSRLAAFAKGRLDYYPERDAMEADDPSLEGNRPDWKRYEVSGGFRYALDPVSSMSLSVGQGSEDYDNGETGGGFFRRDHRSRFAGLGYERSLSDRDAVGLTLSYSHDRFDEVERSVGEETDQVVSAVASWKRDWTPRWSTSLAGGARWVSIDQDPIPGITCLGADCGPSDSGAGFVGSAEVEYRTKLSQMALGYSRETRPSSGYGGNVDVGTVSTRYRRQLANRLSVSADAFFQRYKSAGESALPVLCIGTACLVEVTDSAIDAEVLGANVSLDWRVGEHWTTFARYSYRDQTSDGDRSVTEYDDHRMTVGFRYALPIDIY